MNLKVLRLARLLRNIARDCPRVKPEFRWVYVAKFLLAHGIVREDFDEIQCK